MIREVRMQAFSRICRLVLDDQQADYDALIASCGHELDRISKKFSALHPDSIPNRLNNCAGTGSYVELDKESESLLDFINTLWNQSKHLFDPTTKILQDCYDSNGRLLASKKQLEEMVHLVGFSHLDRSARGGYLTRKGMVLDLDACIRPYAVDNLQKILKRQGVEHALIEFDRDVTSIGKQPNGANWLVGMRLPAGNRLVIERLKLNGKSFAVRGDFENTSVIDGERFGSALSPVDGLPLPGLLTVGIIADNCLTACSAASLARLKTEASGLNWLEKLGMPWVAVDRNLKCHGPLANVSNRMSGNHPILRNI